MLQRQYCDHRKDCKDGSDEDPVECGLLYGSRELADKIVGNAIRKQRRQQEETELISTTTTPTTSAKIITATSTILSNIVTTTHTIQLPPGEQHFNVEQPPNYTTEIVTTTSPTATWSNTLTPLLTLAPNVNNTNRIICGK